MDIFVASSAAKCRVEYFYNLFLLLTDWLTGGCEWLTGGCEWLTGGCQWLTGGCQWLTGGCQWLTDWLADVSEWQWVAVSGCCERLAYTQTHTQIAHSAAEELDSFHSKLKVSKAVHSQPSFYMSCTTTSDFRRTTTSDFRWTSNLFPLNQ